MVLNRVSSIVKFAGTTLFRGMKYRGNIGPVVVCWCLQEAMLQTSQGNAQPVSVTPHVEQAVEAQTLTLMGASGNPVECKVLDLGSGTPVVFLHGLVGLNDHWEDVASRIQSQCRCVLVELPLLDLRGDDCSILGVAALTRAALRTHLGGDSAVVVGNSFGGHVALHLALSDPALIRGLVLAGSSGLIERTTVREVQVRPSREWLVEKIGELFFDRKHVSDADIERAYEALSHRRRARAMIRLSRSARKNHLGDRIGELTAPALLIWGKEDVVTPPEAAREFHRLLPNARTVWFDRCGHVPMVERPDEFAKALLEFVAEIEAAQES